MNAPPRRWWRSFKNGPICASSVSGRFFPEKCASRGPPIGALQNIGSFVRFARKQLRKFGITRRKVDVRLQLRLEETPRWNLYGGSFSSIRISATIWIYFLTSRPSTLFAALRSALLFFDQLLRPFRAEPPERPEFFSAFLIIGDEKVFDLL